MENVEFEPRYGKNYQDTRLLILGESAYSWEQDGEIIHPGPSHPTCQLLHWMENFGQQKYFTAIGRAICRKETPTYDELEKAWDDYAYTLFVQGSVGVGAENRPSKKQFLDAGDHFLRVIDKIRPSKVIVTGKTMWNTMPPCEGTHLCDDIQAYKLPDGALVWCLAVPHPASRTGFSWQCVGAAIQTFIALNFPDRS